MKAGRWVDVGRVVCEEVPRPSPADGEILVRTAYTSICGSDLHSVYGGAPPPAFPPATPGTRAWARWWSHAAPASSRATGC